MRRAEDEAVKKLNRALVNRDDGVHHVPSKQTVAAYLAEWLPAIKSEVGPRTFVSYSQIVRGHLVPRIGSKAPCRSIQADEIWSFCNAKASGRTSLCG